MEILRSIFNYVLRLAGAYVKHEIDNTFRSPQQQRDFNPDIALRTAPPPAPTHKRIVTSEDGRLAATCPGGWVSETDAETLAFGTSRTAVQENIGNITTGEAAIHFDLLGQLSRDGSVRVDQFKRLIAENDTTIYAEADWNQPSQTTLGGKNAAIMTGKSEYGDQVLFMIAQPDGEHVLAIANTAPGESARFEAQFREIVSSVIVQG